MLSLVAFAMVLGHIAMFGVVREADEGTTAHLFQIWIVLEVLLVAFFVARWLPQAPKQALLVLAIQVIAALVVCAPVFYFKF